MYAVDDAVPTRLPLTERSYPVTPTLSVAAVHVSATLVPVVAPCVRLLGALGGVVSVGVAAAHGLVAVTTVDGCETLRPR